MSPATPPVRPLFWIACAALITLLAVGLVMLVVIWPPARDVSWGFTGFEGILGAAIGSMGALVVYRRPGSRVGQVLLLAGLVTAVQLVVDLAPLLVVHQGGAGTAAETWASWLANAGWVPPVTTISYLLLIYPDGRPPGRRWAAVGPLLALAAAFTLMAALLSPGGLYNFPDIDNPTGIPALPRDLLLGVAYPVYMLCQGLAAVSLVARWRSAAPEVRAQLKWLALAAIPFVTATALSTESRPAQYVAIGFGALIPAAIAMAILRNRLYDIDRVISRSIGWAVVTASLGASFVVAVLVLQALLAGMTQGQTLAVATSTLVAFALFQPVRSRVQDMVDRRFDRSRYDAQQMVDGFAGQLRAEVDLPRLRSDLVTTTAHAVRPVVAGVWLRTAPAPGDGGGT